MSLAMKVQMIIKFPSKAAPTTSFGIAVFAKDTAADVKQRIAAAQTLPFPDHELIFDGKVLQDAQRLSDHGVKEGSSLDFVVKANESTLTQQLTALLQNKPLPIDELGLLYVHKYGVSTNDALKALGCEESLKDFLSENKQLTIVNGCVTPATPPSRDQIKLYVSLQRSAPASSWLNYDEEEEETTKFEIKAGVDETVASVKTRAAEAAQVSEAFPELKLTAGGKPLEDETKLSACSLQEGASLELQACASEQSLSAQLASLLQAQGDLSIDGLSLLFSSKYGVSADQVVLSIPGARCRRNALPEFLKRNKSTFSVQSGHVTFVQDKVSQDSKLAVINERCSSMELHDRVSSREFRTNVTRSLTGLVATLMEATFLTISHVVQGGSVGNGTAVEGAAEDAVVTLFIDGVPKEANWQLALLASLSDWLQQKTLESVEVIEIREQALCLKVVDGLPLVEIRLAPVFESHAKALEAVAAQTACQASLAEQEVRFIKKQPEAVKVTARLLKWWCSQRKWSSTATRPSNQLLELLAVNAASKLPANQPYDQEVAIRIASSMMASFSTVAITWPAQVYSQHAVSEAILSERPLLMDPINPFNNVASTSSFDAIEMMAHVAASPGLLF